MKNTIDKQKQYDQNVDILENVLLKLNNNLLKTLLKDQTTKNNILWCTNNYEKYGDGYKEDQPIEIRLITGRKGQVIKPRIMKSKAEKKKRIKEKGEVFTPSWACNHQNNLVDNVWFGAENVFNYEKEDTWITNTNKIEFTGKTWMDYVLDLRLEITCGEAPYVVSRYDTVTGNVIKTENRIGILDRKIRVINENVKDEDEWYKWVKKAYQSVYGYEWQGDSLLIARENLLYTFIDYYEERFAKTPDVKKLRDIAEIISWNFWQMDGLKGVIPNSCDNDILLSYDLFGEPVTLKCPGCDTHNIFKHNGQYCRIKNWKENKVLSVAELFEKELNDE